MRSSTTLSHLFQYSYFPRRGVEKVNFRTPGAQTTLITTAADADVYHRLIYTRFHQNLQRFATFLFNDLQNCNISCNDFIKIEEGRAGTISEYLPFDLESPMIEFPSILLILICHTHMVSWATVFRNLAKTEKECFYKYWISY